MKRATHAIFGDPIPTACEALAEAVDRALAGAERSTEAAVTLTRQLAEATVKLSLEMERRLDAEYLHARNLGGHWYPYFEYGTSDCKYCECTMGRHRSGGPEGVNPFGDCPGNPKLRDAYKLLKEAQEGAK